MRHPLLFAFYFASAIAVVNGFGRFAYSLLLPVMRADLGWDYALSGWLNTANALGYGAGALAGLVLAARFQPSHLFVTGIGATVATLVACAVTTNLYWILLWRFLTGLGSAWVFACGGALVAAHYTKHYASRPELSAKAIGIYYAGGGLGILLSGGLLLPVLEGIWRWPTGWLALGLAGLLLAIWPSKLALDIGGEKSSLTDKPFRVRQFWIISLAYFLFGVGYIVYLTFVISWLKAMQMSPTGGVLIWSVLGLAVTASGFVWQRAISTWWPSSTFAAACSFTAIGTALPIFNQSIPTLVVSAIFVGGSFFMAPSAMMALARKTLAQPLWSKAMSLFTLVFALGQAIGPVAAGAIADRVGLNWAMAAGALTLLVAALLALAQTPKNSPTL